MTLRHCEHGPACPLRQIVPKHPKWLLSGTEATDRETSLLFTPYGDSYYTWVDDDTCAMVRAFLWGQEVPVSKRWG
jgi:hypothetical protein